MPTALVTGGAGYIGSHTCVALLDAGWEVVVVDDLSNSSEVALERVRSLTSGPLKFHRLDLLDEPALDDLFAAHTISAVVHFAGKKAVGESVEVPLTYYENNVVGSVALLKSMQRHGVRDLVFSSSATVYGDPSQLPVTEDSPLAATNPYGRTKLHIEEMLRDVASADARWRIAILRYFNPVGAHPSGTIGEDPTGVPNNLMPFAMQVAVGRRDHMTIFGDDYPTPDGTGVRDYIHVVDLARGHVAALASLDTMHGATAVNLGTGTGHSVLEVVRAASTAAGRDIPYEIGPRRSGDIAAVWADPTRARELLGWQARHTLDEMCTDHWRWQQQNPDGYAATTSGP